MRHPKLTFTLDKHPCEKKMIRLQTRKYKHRTTGEEVEVVEAATLISEVADYTRMTDFSFVLEKRNH